MKWFRSSAKFVTFCTSPTSSEIVGKISHLARLDT